MTEHILTSEQLLFECLSWRGIEPEYACKGCGGSGTKAYGDTSTWRGGVGGQMITSGPCDKCWGSGDEYRKWPSHRRMAGLESEVARLRGKDQPTPDATAKLREAVEAERQTTAEYLGIKLCPYCEGAGTFSGSDGESECTWCDGTGDYREPLIRSRSALPPDAEGTDGN